MGCPFRKFHPSGIGVVTDFFDLGDFNYRGATNNATGGGNMAKAADYPVQAYHAGRWRRCRQEDGGDGARR
jgi:hypothetical protein